MEFAEVPQTPEGVLEFADRYGLIESHFGPACAFWYPHIDAVAHVVASWRHRAGKSRCGQCVSLVRGAPDFECIAYNSKILINKELQSQKL